MLHTLSMSICYKVIYLVSKNSLTHPFIYKKKYKCDDNTTAKKQKETFYQFLFMTLK